ncbi:MAG: hypothetical protein AAGH79_06425 [Bacteroidota bacterium]
MEQTFKQWQNIWIERDLLPVQVQQFTRMFIQISLGLSLLEGLIQAFHPGTEWQGFITCLLLLPVTVGILRAYQEKYWILASNLAFRHLGVGAFISTFFFPVIHILPFSSLMIGAIAYGVFLELEKYRTGTVWVTLFTLLFVLQMLRAHFPLVGQKKSDYTRTHSKTQRDHSAK